MFSFDSPPAPPTAKEDDLSVLRLIRSRRVGPATYHRLVAEHGCAAAALDALPGIAAAAGVRDYVPCPDWVAVAELDAGARAGARLIHVADPDYPVLLREIADAPPVLWVCGRLDPFRRPVVAVIGARNASSLGLRMARGLAQGLAESGLTVAAGLARGIDTAAHTASCSAGTVAVMAGGIDVIYPAENQDLADRIRETGCLVTEQPPGTAPVARHFPARNRIVSGLSAAVVVIEAAHRSGTLITARCAAEQGREVMAVPGHPIDARAAGCNALIRDGATLVRNAADVIAGLGGAGLGCVGLGDVGLGDVGPADARGPGPRWRGGPGQGSRLVEEPCAPTGSDAKGPRGPVGAPPAPEGGSGAGDLRHRLLQLLGPSAAQEDAILRDLAVSPAQLAPVLLDLELDGLVVRLPGGCIALS